MVEPKPMSRFSEDVNIGDIILLHVKEFAGDGLSVKDKTETIVTLHDGSRNNALTSTGLCGVLNLDDTEKGKGREYIAKVTRVDDISREYAVLGYEVLRRA